MSFGNHEVRFFQGLLGEGQDHVEVVGADVEAVGLHDVLLAAGELVDGEPLEVADLVLGLRGELGAVRDA